MSLTPNQQKHIQDVRANTSRTSLKINDATFSPEEFTSLLETLKAAQHVTSINLNYNNINPGQAVELSTILNGRQLLINANPIGLKGAQALYAVGVPYPNMASCDHVYLNDDDTVSYANHELFEVPGLGHPLGFTDEDWAEYQRQVHVAQSAPTTANNGDVALAGEEGGMERCYTQCFNDNMDA